MSLKINSFKDINNLIYSKYVYVVLTILLTYNLYTIKSSILSEQFNDFQEMYRIVHPPSPMQSSLRTFPSLQKVPSGLTALNPRSFPQPQTNTDLLSVHLLLWAFPINGIIQYVVFCIWYLSLRHVLRFIRAVACYQFPVPFYSG